MIGEFEIEAVVLERLILKTLDTEDEFSTAVNNSSVISLWLADNDYLNLELLKMLPNLKYLHVYKDVVFTDVNGNSFTNNLRSYFAQVGVDDDVDENGGMQIPKHFSIWEELPKLETLSASVIIFEILDVQYFRECGNQPFFGYRSAKEGEYGY